MATINFAESIDTVQRDLAEIQPSIFPAVPRIKKDARWNVSKNERCIETKKVTI